MSSSRRRGLPVRISLTLWAVGVLGIALLALGIAVRVTVRAYLTDSVDRELASRAASFARGLKYDPGFGMMRRGAPPAPPVDILHILEGERPHQQPRQDATDINFPRVFASDGRPFTMGPFRDSIPPWDRAALTAVAERGVPVYSCKMRVGQESLRLLSSPVRDETGRIRGVFQIAFRLTDIERGLAAMDRTLLTLLPLALLVTVSGGALLTSRAIRPIERALEQERRFVADASHELRTPLAIIAAATELGLEAEPGDTHIERRSLERIDTAAARTRRIVDDLLILARTEPGARAALPLALEPVPALELLTDAASLFEPLRDGRVITVEVSPTGLTLHADRHHLGRVLSNLLDNAVRHTAPHSGRIVLSAQPYGSNRTLLLISDNGEGIPATDLPHLFRRFYRADPSRARRTGGSGLGLSIARAVVEAHGGSITIESTSGAGTQVCLILPRA